ARRVRREWGAKQRSAAAVRRTIRTGEMIPAIRPRERGLNFELGTSNFELRKEPRNLGTPDRPGMFSERPTCLRSGRRVASRAIREHRRTIVPSTSAPAHAWRCKSSYGPLAYVYTCTGRAEV